MIYDSVDEASASSIEKKNGYLVNYDNIYTAPRIINPDSWVRGWRVYGQNGRFLGLLSVNEVAMYFVDEEKLMRFVPKNERSDEIEMDFEY